MNHYMTFIRPVSKTVLSIHGMKHQASQSRLQIEVSIGFFIFGVENHPAGL